MLPLRIIHTNTINVLLKSGCKLEIGAQGYIHTEVLIPQQSQ